MKKSYNIVGIGPNDSYTGYEPELVGQKIEADPKDVGKFYKGALSGDISKPIFIKDLDYSAETFHQLYVEEIS